jgi:hypothetical protein
MPLLFSIVIGLGGVFALFLPTFLAGDTVVPSRYPDAREVLWTIYHTKQFLAGVVPSLYHTTLLFHPFGASLYLHTTVEALTLPLTWLLSQATPQRIYTIACASCFALNYLAALRLMCAFKLSWLVRTVGAGLIAFHPFFLARLDAGHLNFLCFFGVLLLLHAVVSVAKGERGLVLAFESGIAGVALVFTNAYYLYMAAWLVVLWGGVLFFAQRARLSGYIKQIAIPVAMGVATGSYKVVHAITLAQTKLYTPDHNPRENSADIVSFGVPGVYQLLGGEWGGDLRAAVLGNAIEQSVYLGWGLVALCVVALSVTRNCREQSRGLALGALVLAGLTCIVSLGPVVHFRGVETIANPLYTGLRSVSPLMLSVPARFGLLTIVHLVVALALLLECSTARKSRLSMIALLVVLVCEYLPASVRDASLTMPSAVIALHDRLDIQAVHDFSPTPWDAMFHQIGHGKAITGGFLSRRPKAVLRFYARNAFLKFAASGKESTPERVRAALDELQIQAVIVPQNRPDVRERLGRLEIGEVIAQDDRVVIYRVPSLHARQDKERAG